MTWKYVYEDAAQVPKLFSSYGGRGDCYGAWHLLTTIFQKFLLLLCQIEEIKKKKLALVLSFIFQSNFW